jgi:hypothetical protein
VIELIQEYEYIAQAMLVTRGNLKDASRDPKVAYNAMALRSVVKDNPLIRNRYQELLSEEMQDKGLHISERIMKMAELQEEAYNGGTFIDVEGNSQEVPPDVNTIINLSKEISRLIMEGKGTPMSNKAMVLMTSKEDAAVLLAGFLDS